VAIAVRNSKAIQCDLCYVWVHANCEGISDENYEALSQLSSRINNVAYFCQLNQCTSRSKQLIAAFINPTTNSNTLSSDQAKQFEVVSVKVKNLSMHTSDLESKLNEMSNKISKLAKSSQQPILSNQDSPVGVTKVATNLADELVDHEKRKLNLIIQNLSGNVPETTDADKKAFSAIGNFMSLKIQCFSVKRLGKKIIGRTQPLLIHLDDLDMKWKILSCSSRLKSEDSWKNVYINPDLTCSERNAQRLL